MKRIYIKLTNKNKIRHIYYDDIFFDEYFTSDIYFFNNICRYPNFEIDIFLEEISKIFEVFWEFEFRSSNFSTKIFYFFSIWHTSGMTTSFYDFLLKTKLLQDEKQHRINYDKYLDKKYKKIKKLESIRVKKLWDLANRPYVPHQYSNSE